LRHSVRTPILVKYRSSDVSERLPGITAELVNVGPDVIVASGNPLFVLLVTTTGTIPILGYALVDPVKNGISTSLARPGGNVTGTSIDIDSGLLVAMVHTRLPISLGFLCRIQIADSGRERGYN
jgi:ABC-type uncharacterized transport system substrate-binding protein